MQLRVRPSKPTWLAWLLSVLLLMLIFVAFIAVTHALVGSDVPVGSAAMSRRDTVYFSVHLATIVVGSLVGFLAGKWLNGLGAAFAVLFLVVLVSSLTATQIVTYKVACNGGENNIVRHWTC